MYQKIFKHTNVFFNNTIKLQKCNLKMNTIYFTTVYTLKIHVIPTITQLNLLKVRTGKCLKLTKLPFGIKCVRFNAMYRLHTQICAFLANELINYSINYSKLNLYVAQRWLELVCCAWDFHCTEKKTTTNKHTKTNNLVLLVSS